MPRRGSCDATCRRAFSDRMPGARRAHGTRSTSAAAAPRIFTASAPPASRSTLAELRGISSYEPTELVVTVRAGTPLAELEAALGANKASAWRSSRRALPPRRPAAAPWAAWWPRVCPGRRAARRAAARLCAGRDDAQWHGRALTFGGQVMKNVAGYDVSRADGRLVGILGVICEVSLKVLALPAARETLLRVRLRRAGAAPSCCAGSRGRCRFSASAWHDGRAAPCAWRARRRGGAAPASWRAARRRGRPTPDAWWGSCATSGTRSFAERSAAGERLWRLSLPARHRCRWKAGMPIEWGGAQRWWRDERRGAARARSGGRRPCDAGACARTGRRAVSRRWRRCDAHTPRLEEAPSTRPHFQSRPPVRGALTSADADDAAP